MSIVAEYAYDAWGKILSIYNTPGTGSIGSINPLRYRGYYYDEDTDLYYLHSRYYDPEVGRFLNTDAFVSTGAGFLGFNMFAYCNNNPVDLSDSNGGRPTDALRICEETAQQRAQSFKLQKTNCGIKASKSSTSSSKSSSNKKTSDGETSNTWGLYDSKYTNPDSIYHERLFGGDYLVPSYSLNDNGFSIGADISVYRGTWETEYFDITLFDFGKAEAYAGLDDSIIGVKAMATAY